MNSEEPTLGFYQRVISRPYAIYVLVSVVVVILGVVVIFASRKPPVSERVLNADKTDSLGSARSGLVKASDLATCRSALQQINLYLTEHSKRKPPALTSEQRAFLSETCLADPAGEMGEVESGAYTLLDAYHLAECFLFRDAAESLQVNGLSPAEQVEAAFGWTVRQIQLRDPLLPDSEPVPPEFVVRRGWGTALERAFVFLALLRQMGIEGCIIATPSSNGTPLTWACGALVDTKDTEPPGKPEVLLFDPRMGIALPGPKGEGIATLAGVREHPDQLKALTVKPEFPYDITPELLAGAEILLVEPLSALSPRMALLQKDLLGPSIKARLSADPKESLDHFAQAANPMHVPVRVATRWTGVLRGFLPPDEGGSDDKKFGFSLRSLPGFLGKISDPRMETAAMSRKKLFQLELASWQYLPEIIRDLPWNSDLGQRPRLIFNQFFTGFAMEPRRPRDLLLRGQYDEAVGALVQMRETYDDKKKRLKEATGAELNKELSAWSKRAFDAFADLVRAEQPGMIGGGEPKLTLPEAKHKVEMVWKEGERLLPILLEGVAAAPLSAESTYMIALAWHEQASCIQIRIERDRRAGRAGDAAEVAAALAAWKTAISWWRLLSADPAAGQHSSIARRWQAEAYLALGDKAAARPLLEDLGGNLTPLEKTARLYLASKIKP